MSQNIAFDSRQQTGKLLIQNARGSCSIFWHVALLFPPLTPIWLQPAAPRPRPSTLPLSTFRHESLDDRISNNYPGPRGSADTGQHFGCCKLYFYRTPTSESQEVKLSTEVRVGSKDGHIKNISRIQPTNSTLTICLINLTKSYLC